MTVPAASTPALRVRDLQPGHELLVERLEERRIGIGVEVPLPQLFLGHGPQEEQRPGGPAIAPGAVEMVLRGLVNNSVRSLRLALQSASNFRTLSKILTRLSIRLAQNAVEAEAIDRPVSRASFHSVDPGFFSIARRRRPAPVVE